MSINIQAKQDYSTLFSGLYTSSGTTTSNVLGINLSDYASIKSGSYSKLMKAYYSKNRSEEVEKAVSSTTNSSTKTTSNDTVSTIAKLEKTASSLSDAADKLTNTGKDSLFVEQELTTKQEDGTETKTKCYDRDAIYSAVSDFATQYNNLVTSATLSGNSRVASAYAGITNLTTSNKQALDDIGITVGSDNKLTIDKDKFNAADVDKIQSVFQGSYAQGVGNRAELIETYAQSDVAKASGLYASTGTYVNQLSSGNLYSSLF